jgi:hypothetical protein
VASISAFYRFQMGFAAGRLTAFYWKGDDVLDEGILVMGEIKMVAPALV